MLEKPTTNVPTPTTMAEVNPALNKGDITEVEEVEETPEDFSRPTLGEVATREEYRLNNEPSLDPTNLDDVAEASKATLGNKEDDEKVQTELFSGFAVHDATQIEDAPEDTDELPEDLKDELGEPDDEVEE
jgi:hypothetical protein